jgi:hypothetical protein
MRRSSLALAALLLAGTAGAVPQGTGGGQPPTQAQQAAMKAAAAALEKADLPRLTNDPAYAAEILGHVETLQPFVGVLPDIELPLGHTRAIALVTLKRGDEAAAVGRAMAARQPHEAGVYVDHIRVALFAERPSDALLLLEAARQNLPGRPGLDAFLKALEPEAVWEMARAFHKAKDEGGRHRMAEALLGLGWTGPDGDADQDELRLMAAAGRIEKGDVAGAQRAAAGLVASQTLAGLLVQKRFDPAFEAGADRTALLRRAVEAEDARRAASLRAMPADLKRLRERSRFLRATGKPDEAAALILPAVRDMTAIAKAGADGFWTVNEAADALIDQGKAADAVALMDRLLQLPMDKHRDLINMAINRIELLNEAGRHREAAAEAGKLLEAGGRYASPFGKMWMWSGAACGLAAAGDAAAAAPWLARLEEASAQNPAAHMRGLLCLDRLDAAEALTIRRLAEPDPSDVLMALQDYQPRANASAYAKALEERLAKVRARPAVQAAIAKVGRVIPLPVTRSYWGGF